VRARVYTALRRAGIPLAVPAHTAFVEMHDEARAARHVEREVDERLAALKTVSLFRTFKEDELRKLAAGMTHVLYTAGERITRQGAVAHWLYVMTSGSAEIRIADGGNAHKRAEAAVANVRAPDFFGEMGLMTGESRQADVIALEDIECYRLDKNAFNHVMQERPEVAAEFSRTLAERRVELWSVKEGLSEAEKAARTRTEEERIFARIKEFFALDDNRLSRLP
jgi:CRP-like cAMP-binding protein